MTENCYVCDKPLYHNHWVLQRVDRDGEPVRDAVECCSRECVKRAVSTRGVGVGARL